jgi:organic hydroperoxide reductase OsmC/OhrA
MEPLPHYYKVASDAAPDSHVCLRSEGVVDILSTAPREFGGSGEHWSPEGLLVAAVADCYILSFKALARASKLDWLAIKCDATGKLDRVDKTNKFTEFELTVALTIETAANRSIAERLLEKAKAICLITNSLNAECVVHARIEGGA